MPMTDQELADFINVDVSLLPKVVKTPEQRALYEKMRDVELWANGAPIPKPEGVIVCGPREIREGRGPVRRRKRK